MTSFKTIRDPVTDHLLTPQNAALLIIDFQPLQVASMQSRPKRELVANITALARVGKLYGLPTVLSTVNVKTGRNQPTIHQIAEVLDDLQPFDRTSINAWEDEDFVRAVRATGRKKLIMAALWTEVCLVHPALDAIEEGFEVYPVIDCVGHMCFNRLDKFFRCHGFNDGLWRWPEQGKPFFLHDVPVHQPLFSGFDNVEGFTRADDTKRTVFGFEGL
jgi:isochorismate hydrolase